MENMADYIILMQKNIFAHLQSKFFLSRQVIFVNKLAY